MPVAGWAAYQFAQLYVDCRSELFFVDVDGPGRGRFQVMKSGLMN